MSESTTYSRAVMPETGNFLNAVALAAHFLPKNLISYLVGAVVRIRWPKKVANVVNRAFAAAFRLDLSEAALPLGDYETIEDVFTRKLKPGVRPISLPVCSPADGVLARSQPAPEGRAVQAKGILYSLEELVYAGCDVPVADRPRFAWFQTVYLAPHNYHRVHSPVTGRITEIRYVPGQLWPVNVPFVLRIPQLFVKNERLVFDVELAGGGKVAVVMVGALNVGRMVTPLAPDLVTNDGSRQVSQPGVQRLAVDFAVAAGDELGTFMLGSTVVTAFDDVALARLQPRQLVQAETGRPILMGQSLCREGGESL
jgi:phosphatidylserine decarboxylase